MWETEGNELVLEIEIKMLFKSNEFLEFLNLVDCVVKPGT